MQGTRAGRGVLLQVRNVAFRDVESKLNMLLAARPGMALPSVEVWTVDVAVIMTVPRPPHTYPS